MTCSQQIKNMVCIGTTSNFLYVFSLVTDQDGESSDPFKLVTKVKTSNWIYSFCKYVPEFFVSGQYQGFLEVFDYKSTEVKKHSTIKLSEYQWIYSLCKTDRDDELVLGCSVGLIFGRLNIEMDKFTPTK